LADAIEALWLQVWEFRASKPPKRVRACETRFRRRDCLARSDRDINRGIRDAAETPIALSRYRGLAATRQAEVSVNSSIKSAPA